MLLDVVADVVKELYFGGMMIDVDVMTIVGFADHQVQYFAGSDEYFRRKDEDFSFILLAFEQLLWVGREEL